MSQPDDFGTSMHQSHAHLRYTRVQAHTMGTM